MDTMANQNTSSLCYLSADDVKSPVGDLGGVELRGRDNERLGRLAGVLIDARQRRLRYLVVDAPGGRGRCCLVNPDELVCLDTAYRTMRLDAPAADVRPEFDLDFLRCCATSQWLAAAAF